VSGSIPTAGGNQREGFYAEPFLATDPYRPPVGATLLDDTPFVIKGSEKLPAGMEGEAT